MFRHTRAALLLLLLLLLAPRPTPGWGVTSHVIVANLAWKLLHTETTETVSQILEQSERYYDQQMTTRIKCSDNNSNYYCSPLARFSEWADDVKPRLGEDGPNHRIMLSDDGGSTTACLDGSRSNSTDCSFVYSRDCISDHCVVGAIVRESLELLSLHSAAADPGRAHARDLPRDDECSCPS